ncbi:MAG TPA: MarR family transcriptional regulator [Natronosporangium sp.]
MATEAERVERLHQLLMELVRLIVMRHPDPAAGEQSISLSQTFALHELDTGTPLSQQELADRLGLEKSSVSRLAAELERRGLLVRERVPSNRRVYRLRLTEQGKAAHRQRGAAFHEQYLRWTEAMTPAELDALITGLAAFVRVATADRSAGS